MEKKVTDAHVVKIAKFLPKWKVVSKLLGLGLEGQIIRDIEDRCRSGEDQRSEALMKWVGKEGPRATYRTLYDVLIEMEEGAAAEKVKELTRDVCTLVVLDVAGQDHCCLVSSDGGSTKLTAYKMMTSPHGIALIISNIEFDKPFFGQGLPNRTGGDVDEMNLQDLFGPDCLNYKVVLLKNLTGEQIETAFCLVSGHKGSTYAALHKHDKEALKALSDGGNLISKDHDSFVCCLLSHGNKGKVCGTDGKKFDLSNIYYYLGPCKHLEGKPKMAFIQACQGDKIAEHDGAQQPSAVEDDGGITTKSSDFILSCAAFHGQKSFRSCTEGTWYISALCRIFKENHKKMDVVSMITDVHNEVSNKEGYEEGITDKEKKCQQCPRLEFTLRYKVQLAVKARQGAGQM